MNDWWKLALGGAAGAGLLAATGGAAAPALLGEGAAAAAVPAADAGAAAAAGGLGGLGGAAPAAEGVGMFVTPPVTPWAASAPLDGMLSGTSMAYGSPAALADAGAAAEPQGLLAQGMGYAKDAGKAASAYGTVTNAMGGGQQQQHQAPQGRPVFQGDAPQIAQAASMAPVQSPTMQSGGDAGGMLRAIAQQRLGKRY